MARGAQPPAPAVVPNPSLSSRARLQAMEWVSLPPQLSGPPSSSRYRRTLCLAVAAGCLASAVPHRAHAALQPPDTSAVPRQGGGSVLSDVAVIIGAITALVSAVFAGLASRRAGNEVQQKAQTAVNEVRKETQSALSQIQSENATFEFHLTHLLANSRSDVWTRIYEQLRSETGSGVLAQSIFVRVSSDDDYQARLAGRLAKSILFEIMSDPLHRAYLIQELRRSELLQELLPGGFPPVPPESEKPKKR